MIDDMKRRGFDGVVVDWYGAGSIEDLATQKIRDYIASDPSFKLIVMLDKGIASLSQSVLAQQLQYCEQQYFDKPSYEHDGGKSIVMFFGVEEAIGSAAMSAVKASTGANEVWVEEGAGTLARAWVDQSFDWTHDYHDGPSATDPYDLAGVRAYYAAVGSTPKHAFGSMVAGFDGMLTNNVAWSKGKYLPRGNGACVVEWAHAIDQVIPPNVTRMQWATWSDWEEGTAIEAGVENDIAVTATFADRRLAWTVSGDESTVDHYEIYGTVDGATAIDLGTTHAHELAVTAPCTAFSVVAVGKPTIRDHASAWIH
jgi:hypothetical protein